MGYLAKENFDFCLAPLVLENTTAVLENFAAVLDEPINNVNRITES